MALDWNDLRIAIAIGRAGSLTRAAELLGIDQSTATRRLSALEAALGTVLFVRSKAGLTPTDAGEVVIARASDVELRLDRLAEQLSAGSGGPVGTVRILGNPWVLDRLAARALAPFLAAHPLLDLRTVGAPPRLPTRGDATVSLWFEAPPRELEFAIRLASVPYAVYAPRGIDPAALGWVSFLDEDTPRLAPTRTLQRLRQRDERVRFTATDATALVSAVAAGVGKGLLPVCLAAEAPALVRIGAGEPELVRGLHLHLHPDTVQTARVQAVIRWLRETVEPLFGDAPVASSGAMG